MKNDKTELYQYSATGQMFRMSKEQMDELVKEKQKLLNDKLIKETEICSYWDYIEEFVNPYLPDDKKIVASLGDNLPDLYFDEPFGIIVKF